MAEMQVFGGENEKVMLSLIREIAMDIHPIETILKNHSITFKQYENYLKIPRFQQMLAEARAAWGGAANVSERIRLKHLHMVEEGSAEMWRLLHDVHQPLSARVELYKTLMKGAGIGAAESIDTSGKVNITINLGAAAEPLRISAELPGKVIDGELAD